jgi:hypothetical protein
MKMCNERNERTEKSKRLIKKEWSWSLPPGKASGGRKDEQGGFGSDGWIGQVYRTAGTVLGFEFGRRQPARTKNRTLNVE